MDSLEIQRDLEVRSPKRDGPWYGSWRAVARPHQFPLESRRRSWVVTYQRPGSVARSRDAGAAVNPKVLASRNLLLFKATKQAGRDWSGLFGQRPGGCGLDGSYGKEASEVGTRQAVLARCLARISSSLTARTR